MTARRRGVRVRAATAADAVAISAVRNASWQAAYGEHLPPDYWPGYDNAAAVDRYAAIITGGRTTVLVAEDEGVIGYTFYGACRDDDVAPGTREIYAIYVHPDAWSTGAGRALMTAALEDLGDGPVVLWVLTVNRRAQRFYRLAGFLPDGTEKLADMPGGQLPELRMRRG